MSGITALSIVLSTQAAFAQERSVILPTRLDFDASRVPEKCDSQEDFLAVMDAWVPRDRFRDDAERRLVVRIYRSSTGGKQADVSLVDAQGVTMAKRHQDFLAQKECHYVLWKTATYAAEILGAFEPPLPKDPLSCPASSPCPLYFPPAPCPACAQLRLSRPTITLFPTPYHYLLGIGPFVASGIYSELNVGPHLMLGFMLSRELPDLHIEFEASWTSQMSPSAIKSESIRMHSIPLVGSLCWVRGMVRFCGGLASTIFYSNQSSDNDPLHIMFGANFRVGTELFTRGPFSIRADVFGRLAFAQRTFGNTTMALDEPTPFTAGVAVTAGRSFD